MEHLNNTPDFHFLTPDSIIALAEKELDVQLSNICRPYKSYINRVYELHQEDGTGLVIKFYRPGRWSKEALQDEHDFLVDLENEEIPVIAPIRFKNGKTLGEYGSDHFAVFPKKGGRNCDEFSEGQWLEIGRLIGRVHAVGAKKNPGHRITLTPDKATTDHVDYIINGGFVPKDLIRQFKDISCALVEMITPLFEGKPLIRIHGDCHTANIIYRPDDSFYLIDLDDMALGTPIQDVWMLLPGYVKDSKRELSFFIEGYETFRHFDRSDIKLIEPLRAMRYIHFIAWCTHQVSDGGFSSVSPNWGTNKYWQTEIRDLAEQMDFIKKECF